MKKKIFPCFLVVFLVSIFFQNGFGQLSSRETKEIQGLAKEAISKEALKAIDNILVRRISKVVQMNKEDAMFHSQFKNEYKDEFTWSNALLEYFGGRKEIMKVIRTEIQGCYKETKELAKNFYKGKPGYNLVTTFKDYFNAYQDFINGAFIDIEDKVRATKMYQAIVLIEMNQQYFYESLEKNDLQIAKAYLLKEAELIGNYREELEGFCFKKNIPETWQKDFIEAYSKIHGHNTKRFEAKANRDDKAYMELVKEGTRIIFGLPWIKSARFCKEVLENIEDIPNEMVRLEEHSKKMGIKAYTLYFIQKEKAGEKPLKF